MKNPFCNCGKIRAEHATMSTNLKVIEALMAPLMEGINQLKEENESLRNQSSIRKWSLAEIEEACLNVSARKKSTRELLDEGAEPEWMSDLLKELKS